MASTSFVTNKGLAILANRIKGLGTEPVYLAWGTGAGTAAATDESLFTEAAEARTQMVSSIVTVGPTGDSYQLSGSIVAAAAKTITNWGVFDALTGGNLLMHESLDPGVPYEVGQVGVFLCRLQFMRPQE